MVTKIHQPPPQFAPPRTGPCLCGSGLAYKRCCADRLPGTQGLGSITSALLNEERYKEALVACRADVTQYTIWHKSHTEPAIRNGMPKKGGLFEVDLRALADIVDTLLECHTKTNRMDEFPAVLERLRNNIKDITWQRKIVYFHAIHALRPDWNESAGRKELKKLGSITDDDDIETLQLWLDLFGDYLSFSEKQDIIDRILALSKKLSDRLHYRGSKAALYFTIGDLRRAEIELVEIIEEVSSDQSDQELDEYERLRLAMTFDFLGALRRDDTLLAKALKIYEDLLSEDCWTTTGRANLLGHAGDTYRNKAEWDNARKTYVEALALKSSAIKKVFLVDCLIQLNQNSQAEATLSEVKLQDLSPAEQVDYAFTLATLAIQGGRRKELENAKMILKTVTTQDPYFQKRLDAFLLGVQEAMTSGTSQSLTKRTRRLLADITRSAASYLILKPSFMGVGVDIGKILEDASKRATAHQQKADDKNTSSK
jgi:tetratricopeptide (TPR) repeat protein